MDRYTEDVKIFKALGDEKRLCILELLKEGEACACELMERMKMQQSALSYHMKILCESGIVASRQDGRWTHYRMSASGSAYAMQRLSELTSATVRNDAVCGID